MDEKRRRGERERKVVMIIILIDSVVFDCIFPNVVVSVSVVLIARRETSKKCSRSLPRIIVSYRKRARFAAKKTSASFTKYCYNC